MKADTRSWVRFAESDYRQVLKNATEPVEPEGICYHGQQCVEKYLKAVLEEAGRPIPKTHDLGNLLGATQDVLPELGNLTAEIIRLSSLFVVSRYPTAEEMLYDLAEESVSAQATMRLVRRIVREHLGLPQDS